MTLAEVLEFLNKPNTPDTKKEVGVFLSVSLHTKGVCPSFKADTKTVIPDNHNSDYDEIFNNRLLSRHPREPEVTRNWRLSQYKPFTKEPFGQITDVISGAIFQDGQYTISLPNKDDNDYLLKNHFGNTDLISYFRDVILKSMLEDPNGYLVTMPKKPSYEGLAEPTLHYVCIKDVIKKPSTGDFIFYSKDRKFIYWITDQAIIRLIQTKDKKWIIEDERGYYAHLFGYIPANILGGRLETDGYYNSFLEKAVPIADEYVSNYSAKQLVDKEASHPYIQQTTLKCTVCEGTGQIQQACEITQTTPSGFKLSNCSKCKGAGEISVNPADRFEMPLKDMDKDAVRIINPDVTINQYHSDNCKELRTQILTALNLTMIEQAQSGTAKAIDQEKLYQFISNISNHIFDNLIYSAIVNIIRYRNIQVSGNSVLPTAYVFTLVKPQQFSIKTATDLLFEISETQKSNLPLYIRRKMVEEYVDKRFGSDDLFARKSQIINFLDPLSIYSVLEVTSMIQSNLVSREDFNFSVRLPKILDEIEVENSQKFILESSFEKIGDKVNEIMKKASNSLPKIVEKVP